MEASKNISSTTFGGAWAGCPPVNMVEICQIGFKHGRVRTSCLRSQFNNSCEFWSFLYRWSLRRRCRVMGFMWGLTWCLGCWSNWSAFLFCCFALSSSGCWCRLCGRMTFVYYNTLLVVREWRWKRIPKTNWNAVSFDPSSFTVVCVFFGRRGMKLDCD